MPQHDRLVDLDLSEPRLLVDGVEDLDSDGLSPPRAAPDLAEAALPDDVHQLHLASNAALDQQGKTRPGA